MGRGPRDTFRGRMHGYGSSGFWKAVGEGLYECADHVRAEAHRSITAGSQSGKNHKPSAPGQPPNNDTRTLADSGHVVQPGPTEARVVFDAPYADDLEFGTSKMAERPFLRPARDKFRPKALEVLRKRINAALRTE